MKSESETSTAFGAGSARRVDSETGVEELAEFFGDGPERMLGIRYSPTRSQPVGGVVICEPLAAQFVAYYRFGALMARRLAAMGFAVQRFHYRGTGNSDEAVITIDSVYEDALSAADLLREATGLADVGFVGVQVGALPAARASRDGSPLIVDSPPSSGRLFLRNAFRAHAVALMQDGIQAPSRDEILRDLRDNGAVALLSSRMPLSLYESIESRSLVEEFGDTERPVLIVGGGREGRLRTELDRIREDLEARGSRVDTVVLQKEDPFWYVVHSAPEEQPEARQTAGSIGEWLMRQFGNLRTAAPDGHD